MKPVPLAHARIDDDDDDDDDDHVVDDDDDDDDDDIVVVNVVVVEEHEHEDVHNMLAFAGSADTIWLPTSTQAKKGPTRR